jgi:hypothetical protein
MVRRLAVTAGVFVLASQLSGQVPPISLQAPNGGTIEVHGLKAKKQRGGVEVSGEVVNLTPADFDALTLTVTLFDRQGSPMPLQNSEIMLFAVGRGTPARFERTLRGKLNGEIGRVDLGYGGGQYQVAYQFALVKPTPSEALEYEDEFLKVRFSIPENKQIAFALLNKTDEPIVIPWDQVSFVDVENKSHKVMHQGVRFIERDQPQSPTTIPPGALVEDFVYPSDAATFLAGQWITPMIFPHGPRSAEYKGKNFSVFMPLQVSGAVKNYNFVFTVADVR